MKLTFISDVHGEYYKIKKDLIDGDIIICAGDSTSVGKLDQIEDFCKWISNLNYKYKIIIAGNHDWGFQRKPELARAIVNKYSIIYLQDSEVIIDGVKIWGSPWQPEFFNWAFNLPRNGKELEDVWNKIPNDTDILITHGPPFGYNDKVIGNKINLGCEKLSLRVIDVKPKIHVFGHIHSGNGYRYNMDTHFFNASLLDESYYYTYKPYNIEWDNITNEITFI